MVSFLAVQHGNKTWAKFQGHLHRGHDIFPTNASVESEGRFMPSKPSGVRQGYTLHESPNLTYQKSRKLGVFDRKLEGSHFIFHFYYDIISY